MNRIAEAAALIRAGRLVAFPTETVYGLGANALDAEAVERIFAAKGRPRNSPLIVHVCSVEMAEQLALRWPAAARGLARRFWPGPLTLVVEKLPVIPDIVTAGLPTVALRMPAHPLALALLREAGVPIAAPSANRFAALSPTTAEHVRASLGDAVDMILDGGPSEVGIESTVLSLAGSQPVLLRRGMIGVREIEDVVGGIAEKTTAEGGAHESPGMHARHYSPLTPLLLVSAGGLPKEGRGAYLWLTPPGAPAGESTRMPADPARYAAALYATLHALDIRGFDWIAVERPPDEPKWAGILDRLLRASVRRPG